MYMSRTGWRLCGSTTDSCSYYAIPTGLCSICANPFELIVLFAFNYRLQRTRNLSVTVCIFRFQRGLQGNPK